jgi:hypothetical protein
MKQVFERAECWWRRHNASRLELRGQGKIGPLRRDHGFAAIGQDQNKMHSTFAAQRLPNREGLALKGMTSAGYSDFLRKVLMMGSVSWFPSIE